MTLRWEGEKTTKLYLKHFKVCKRIRRMEIKGFAGVLHEPVIIVTKVKVWKKHFFMELFQGEKQDMC